MLIGIHVSTAGGLDRAVERGAEREADAIQIFNQSPRAWRPTRYSEDDFAAFREAFDASRLEAVVIHAIYLINLAGDDREVRDKSMASLAHALRVGDGIAADGVVVHAGSRKRDPYAKATNRAGKAIRRVLEESEACPLLVENTAGTQGPLGRNFDELDAKLGLDRVHCLHVNDSAAPQASNRDRHADLGTGEMGKAGLRPFLSEPHFEKLPALIETNKSDDAEHDRIEVKTAKRLRREGIRRRRGKRRSA